MDVPDVAVPAVIYTDPEIATVGLDEQGAKDKGIKIKVNEWNHAAFVKNMEEGTVSFYVNGAFIETKTFDPATIGQYTTSPQNCGSNSLKIGRYSASGGQHFDGLIDEASIYSVALTTSQIQQLYVEGIKRHLATE